MDDARQHVSRRDALAAAGSLLGAIALGTPALAQPRRGARRVPRLEPLFDVAIDVGARRKLGDTPAGARERYPVTGGTLAGPTLRGTVLKGFHWLVRRPGGAVEFNVRLILRTDDDQLIDMQSYGIIHEPPTRGGAGASKRYWHVPTAFGTSSPEYEGLNRLVAVAVGDSPPGRPEYRPEYTVHAVR